MIALVHTSSLRKRTCCSAPDSWLLTSFVVVTDGGLFVLMRFAPALLESTRCMASSAWTIAYSIVLSVLASSR